MLQPALFLDRDGVINVDHGYVHRSEDFDFIPGIFELVRKANVLNYKVVVVTNQAGIGRGYYTETQFQALTEWMCQRFREEGATVDKVYHCPFHPEHGLGPYKKDSEFRKPRPGMLLLAAQELGIDLGQSIMVGDKASDIMAAIAAGIPKRFLLSKKTSLLEAINIDAIIDVIDSLNRHNHSNADAGIADQ